MWTGIIIYLCGGCSCNERGGWVLNLHFVKQNVAIFGYLDVACTTDQHLHGSFRTEIGFQHILNQTTRCIPSRPFGYWFRTNLDAFGGRNVDSQSLSSSSNFRLGIEHRNGSHF